MLNYVHKLHNWAYGLKYATHLVGLNHLLLFFHFKVLLCHIFAIPSPTLVYEIVCGQFLTTSWNFIRVIIVVSQ